MTTPKLLTDAEIAEIKARCDADLPEYVAADMKELRALRNWMAQANADRAAFLAHIEAMTNPTPRAGAVTEITDEMVSAAINALVYTGYNDETQIKVIRDKASCREYVRAALEAAIKRAMAGDV